MIVSFNSGNKAKGDYNEIRAKLYFEMRGALMVQFHVFLDRIQAHIDMLVTMPDGTIWAVEAKGGDCTLASGGKGAGAERTDNVHKAGHLLSMIKRRYPEYKTAVVYNYPPKAGTASERWIEIDLEDGIIDEIIILPLESKILKNALDRLEVAGD